MGYNLTALKELGLSEHESLIYLSLLKLGGSAASTVAKDIGIKRTTVYALLKNLAEKGFVTLYHKKNKQLYYAEKPQRVVDYYEKKVKSFEAFIPSLETLSKKQAQMTGIRFIETIPELKKFYGDILKEYKNKKYHIIGDAAAWENLAPEFFVQFRKDRAKANTRTQLLLTSTSKTTNPENSKLLREVKFLPKKYSFKSTIDIYKDKILIVSPEISSLAVVIEVPAMTDVFRAMFEMLWDMTK